MGSVIPMDLWDVERTAQFFGKSVTWVYRMARAGKIPSIRVGGEYRFSPVQLQRWVEEHTRGAAAASEASVSLG
jgi:excisionase family DNA binding protein